MNLPAGQPRVILVEDDESMSRLMMHCLAKAGFAVERVADGRAALNLVERSDVPDLIIIDYLMPYADGLKVTRALRERPVWEAVPIICVTGTTHDDTMIQGLRIHSDGFLSKPFEPAELVSLARQLIGGNVSAAGAPVPGREC